MPETGISSGVLFVAEMAASSGDGLMAGIRPGSDCQGSTVCGSRQARSSRLSRHPLRQVAEGADAAAVQHGLHVILLFIFRALDLGFREVG